MPVLTLTVRSVKIGTMIKAVLFDMDGLMFDTESAYSAVETTMSEKRGKVFTRDLKKTLMGRKADEVMSLLNDYWGCDENVQDLLVEQDEELVGMYRESVEKLDGLDNLLHFLNENAIQKCIGTSSRRFLVDVLLHKHKLENEFAFVVSGDMVLKGKPDPEIYQQCIAKLGIPSTQCLVLEDSTNGIQAGIAAGCVTCAIPSVYTEDQDFSIASLTCKSLSDASIKNFILADQLHLKGLSPPAYA